MNGKLTRIGLLLLLIILAGAGYGYFSRHPEQWQEGVANLGVLTQPGAETRLTASGFIEANEVTLSAEVSGRIKQITVDQGDPVSAGQALVFLDTSLIAAQTQQIEAQIELARAQLVQAQAGVAPEQIAVAEAALSLAEAERDAAYQAWQDAMRLRDTPQELDAQIDAAAAELEIARLKEQQAALIRDALDLREDMAKESWNLLKRFPFADAKQASTQWDLASMTVWEGWTNWQTAQAAVRSAQNKLATLQSMKANPLEAEVHVTQAKADYDAKVAAVSAAQARLARLRAPVPQSQLDTLKANLQQVRSRLASVVVQRTKHILVSPVAGVVVDKPAHPGEIAVPGNTLLTVANLDQVTLTVYVPAADYGRLRENQAVEVTVDSYPGQVFRGVITRISDEAEFTPKNVQTREERVNLVYAVKITLPNEAHKLKPGMPADATFVEALPG